MNVLSKLAALGALVALAACTNPEDLGDGNSVDLNGAGTGVGSGLVSDPTSPAYFNQAIGDRVLFAVDQSTLSAEAQATLGAQAQWLLTNTDYTATIEGHADEQGTREYNLALGARRANAMKDYVSALGVASSRLNTVSYGKERPAELGTGPAVWAKNRRAVAVVR